MKRFLSALFVAAVLLGAVALSQLRLTRRIGVSPARDSHGHDGAAHQQGAAGTPAVLTITVGFDALRDPFALRLDPAGEAPRIHIRHAERDLLVWTQDVRRGQVIVVSNLFFEGEWADLHVEASPGTDEARRACPLRLQMARDGVACSERTLWSPGDGHKLSAEIRLGTVPALQRLDRGLGRDAGP